MVGRDASTVSPPDAMTAATSMMTFIAPKVGWLLALFFVAYVLRILCRRLVFFLAKDEQLVITQLTDTEVRNGPGIQFVSPLAQGRKRKAELLEALDYVKIKDTLTGNLRVEAGPQLHFLGAFDEVQDRGNALSLTPTEYCIVLDKRTGEKSIKRGPRVLVPGALEHVSHKQAAHSLESNQYLRLLDT